jgi:hypothetical protein
VRISLRPESRRVLELLVSRHALTAEQVEQARAACGVDESFGSALLRLHLITQDELADALARVSGAPRVSLAPYPRNAVAIDPRGSSISRPAVVALVVYACAQIPAVIVHDYVSLIATVVFLVALWGVVRPTDSD